MGRKRKKTWEEMTELERLQEENERLRTEVAYLKVRGKGRSLRARKAETVREMVSGGFRLYLLLETACLARSTYYYQLKQLDQPDKDKDLKDEIQAIYNEHTGNYGYRRIHLELRNRGFVINHRLEFVANGSILPTKERLARKQSISFNASLKHRGQWKSAIRM